MTRIVRYQQGTTTSWGFAVDDGILDHALVAGARHESVAAYIASGGWVGDSELVGLDASAPWAGAVLLPPVVAGKILCAGANYGSHREEDGLQPSRPPYPTIFPRFQDSLVGHGQDLIRPAATDQFDYEGELAVVIGSRADRVSIEDAGSHVFGYTCFNDGTARDWQGHSGQWFPGKTFPSSGSIGPWIVPAVELSGIDEAVLTTRVNGDVRQRAPISDMLFGISELISYCSFFTPLEPGDLIATGTPGGVGFYSEPSGLLADGDLVEIDIDGIGTLRNRVRSSSGSRDLTWTDRT